MKCDRCGAAEATVHEVTIRSGKKVERHLCELCAKGEGLPVQAQHASVAQVLGQFIAQQASGGAIEPARAGACASCGTTYAQFRQDGLLGCPDCYATFEGQLGPLLERAHEGGTHHVGKVPRRLSGPGAGPQPTRTMRPPAPLQEPAKHPPAAAARASTPAPPAPPVVPATPVMGPEPALPAQDRAKQVELLRRKLAEAISAEQYEAAAKIRDELRQLGEPAAKPGPGGAPGGSGGGT